MPVPVLRMRLGAVTVPVSERVAPAGTLTVLSPELKERLFETEAVPVCVDVRPVREIAVPWTMVFPVMERAPTLLVPAREAVPLFDRVRLDVEMLPLTDKVVDGAMSSVPVPDRSRLAFRAMEAVVFRVPPRTMSLVVSPSWSSELIERVPALMLILPTNELVPPRMSVPSPAFVRPLAVPVMVEVMEAVTPEAVEMVLFAGKAPPRLRAVPPEIVEPSVPVAKVMPLLTLTVPDRVTVAGEVLKMAAFELSHAVPVPSASVDDQAVPPEFCHVPAPPRVVSPPSQKRSVVPAARVNVIEKSSIPIPSSEPLALKSVQRNP